MKNIDYENLQFLSELIATDMKILTTKEDLGYNVTKIDNVAQGRDIRYKTELDDPYYFNFYFNPIYTDDEITGINSSWFRQPMYYVEYNGKMHFFCGYYQTTTPLVYFHKIFDGKKFYDSGIVPPIMFNLRYGRINNRTYCSTNHTAVVCVYNNNIHIIGKTKDTDDSSDSSWNYHFYGDGESEWQTASSFPEPLYKKYINGIVYNNKIHVFIGNEDTSDLTMKHYSWNGSSWTKHSDLPFTFYNSCNSVNLHVFNDEIVFPVVCNTSNEICLYTLNTNNNYQKVLTYSDLNINITTSNIGYVVTHVYNDKLYINNTNLNLEGFWNGNELYLENRHVLNSANIPTNNYYGSGRENLAPFTYKNQLYILQAFNEARYAVFIYKCGHHINTTNIYYLEE